MDRREFMEKLQRALAGGLSSSGVAENVRYYEDYIDTEVRKGRSEAEVLSVLGDPRLLAKSIIEANKRAGYSAGTNQNFDEETWENDGRPQDSGTSGRVVRMPGWLLLLIVVVVMLLVIGVVFHLISFLAPVIIPVLIVVLIYQFFRSR